MKKTILLGIGCALIGSFAFGDIAPLNPQPPRQLTPLNTATAHKKKFTWLDSFEAAQKEAEKSKLPIFALFTGSDWCPWCVKLHNEVLESKEFKKYAKENLVLFIADFPQSKKISDKVKRQNQKLAKDYGVRGYPTVLLIDAEGKELARTGYKQGGGKPYVEHLKSLLEKK
ncbi:MAG: thioredoxin family protein [Kiritimatiellae bacterium]|nr:thioredoxin family protein [Kiritimatiellia bacterium]